MKVIPLTRNLFAKVDDEDYEKVVNLGKWYANYDGHNFYAYRRDPTDKTKRLSMHSYIMGSKFIDHCDGDTLNNQKKNLRQATQHQQVGNAALQSNNTSGYRGVIFDKQTGRWSARLLMNGKRKNLGRFPTKEEAALAYNLAAKEYFGEFARLNSLVDHFSVFNS